METPNKEEMTDSKEELAEDGTQPKEELKDYSKIQPRNYQIRVEDALNLKPYELMSSGDDGRVHISKADIILIYTMFKGGIMEFYDNYISFVNEMIREKGYVVVPRPHYFLKNIIDNK
ncbi:hypothetical protein UT300003_33070 [Clostridium sardiniense]